MFNWIKKRLISLLFARRVSLHPRERISIYPTELLGEAWESLRTESFMWCQRRTYWRRSRDCFFFSSFSSSLFDKSQTNSHDYPKGLLERRRALAHTLISSLWLEVGLYANCFNVWDSGKYTKRGDHYERGTAGQWHEYGPIVDAHGWGGGCEHGRPEVRLPNHPIFNAFLRSTPKSPICHVSITLSPCTSSPLSPVHYIILQFKWQIKNSPMFSFYLHLSISQVYACCFNPHWCLVFPRSGVGLARAHYEKQPPSNLRKSNFSTSSWRFMTDRDSQWRSKGQLMWTLWKRTK